VLVSAFAFGGIPEKAITMAFAETDIYVSPSLLEEYREVPLILENEKKLTQAQLKALISGLAAFVTRTIVVHPRKKISICRDPADNMLLECCFEPKADILISGDSLNPLPLTLYGSKSLLMRDGVELRRTLTLTRF
jgi:putative PIN family toxin of toxin-antitoxin system